MVTKEEARSKAQFQKKCLEIVQHLDGYSIEQIDHILNAVRTISACMAKVDCHAMDFKMLWNDMLAQVKAAE